MFYTYCFSLLLHWIGYFHTSHKLQCNLFILNILHVQGNFGVKIFVPVACLNTIYCPYSGKVVMNALYNDILGRIYCLSYSIRLLSRGSPGAILVDKFCGVYICNNRCRGLFSFVFCLKFLNIFTITIIHLKKHFLFDIFK
jgi:hypothetical protein